LIFVNDEGESSLDDDATKREVFAMDDRRIRQEVLDELDFDPSIYRGLCG
jgi:hypothetical protein